MLAESFWSEKQKGHIQLGSEQERKEVAYLS